MTEQYTPTTEEVRELIAEAREQAAYLRGVSRDGSMPYSGELLKFLADALEAMHAERDAALARIAEVAELHYRDTPSVGGDWCPEDHHEWPCPTAVALGLNEGESK